MKAMSGLWKKQKKRERLAALTANLVRNGEIEEVKEILKKAELTVDEEHDDKSLLHWAIIGKQSEMMKLLINRGADINWAEGFKYKLYASDGQLYKKDVDFGLSQERIDTIWDVCFSPLMRAIDIGFVDGVRLLIDKGAEVNFKALNLMTPMILAMYRGNKEIISIMTTKGANPVISVDYLNKVLFKTFNLILTTPDFIQWLTSIGAEINYQNDSGNSVLHYANLNVTKKLLHVDGINISLRKEGCLSPIEFAYSRNDKEKVLLLKQSGAEMTENYIKGAFNTASSGDIQFLKDLGYKEIISGLQQKKANIQAQKQQEQINANIKQQREAEYWERKNRHKFIAIATLLTIAGIGLSFLTINSNYFFIVTLIIVGIIIFKTRSPFKVLGIFVLITIVLFAGTYIIGNLSHNKKILDMSYKYVALGIEAPFFLIATVIRAFR